MAGILDLMGYVQKQGDMGRERGQQTRLGQLAGQSYSAPEADRGNLLSQMAQINPEFAQQQQTQMQGQDDRIATKAKGAATYMLEAYNSKDPARIQGAYQAVRPFLEEIGRASGKIPPNDFSEDMLPGLYQAVGQGGGEAGKQAEQFTLSPGSARYGPDGQLLVQQPFQDKPPGYRIMETADGFAYVPESPQMPQGGPQQAPQGQGGFGIAETDGYVRNILGKAGQIDPNASPEQIVEQLLPHVIKQESGGDPNAVSPKGARGLMQVMPETGRDPGFGVRPLQNNSPEENVRFGRDYLTAMIRRYPGQPALALAAYNAGFGVADKFAGGQASAGGIPGGTIPIPGMRPKPVAPEKPSALQERLQIARSMGASDAELRAIALGQNSTNGPTQAERKDALARKAKQPQLQNAVRGLSRIESALQALTGGMVNTGPMDQYATRYTKAGQELEAAVGGIQNSFLSLTRVPGIGSQSDLEARIASMQYPSLDKDPAVNARTMENLRAFAQDLQAAYQIADEAVAADVTESTAIAVDDDESLFGKYID